MPTPSAETMPATGRRAPGGAAASACTRSGGVANGMLDTGTSADGEHALGEQVQDQQDDDQLVGVVEFRGYVERQHVHQHADEDPAEHRARQAAETSDYGRGEGLQH